jgi:DNA-binding CsgD family transcriptional regulator
MARLRLAELEAVVELLGVACELEGPDAFPVEFLEEIQRVSHASCGVGYFFLDRRAQSFLAGTYVGADDDVDPDTERELERVYWDTVDTCPTFRHQDRTGDRSTVRISELVSRRAYHALPIYQEYFRPQGVEHGVEVPLPAPPGLDRFLILWRAPSDPDFSDGDGTVLEVLRPHLGRMLELAELRRRLAGERPAPSAALTPREQEILDLVAEGKTNAEVARVLWVAPSTVKKHLENIYAKLGVGRRAAAVTRGRGSL